MSENKLYNYDDQKLCEACYNRRLLNKQQESSIGEWTCENCGRVNYGEVLCKCEQE